MKILLRWAFAGLGVLAMGGSGASEGGERLRSLQQLCIAELTTGFDWEKGRWVRTRFVEETYVVSKVDPPKDVAEAERSGRLHVFLACGEMSVETELVDENHRIFHACLQSHEVGAENPKFMACRELHRRHEGAEEWAVTIACPNAGFYFEPNGQFHLGSVHGMVEAEPEDDYKDSLFVSVGRCASFGGDMPNRP